MSNQNKLIRRHTLIPSAATLFELPLAKRLLKSPIPNSESQTQTRSPTRIYRIRHHHRISPSSRCRAHTTPANGFHLRRRRVGDRKRQRLRLQAPPRPLPRRRRRGGPLRTGPAPRVRPPPAPPPRAPQPPRQVPSRALSVGVPRLRSSRPSPSSPGSSFRSSVRFASFPRRLDRHHLLGPHRPRRIPRGGGDAGGNAQEGIPDLRRDYRVLPPVRGSSCGCRRGAAGMGQTTGARELLVHSR